MLQRSSSSFDGRGFYGLTSETHPIHLTSGQARRDSSRCISHRRAVGRGGHIRAREADPSEGHEVDNFQKKVEFYHGSEHQE